MISSKLTAKPITFIFSQTLISTYLSSKKISHINLKVPVNNYKEFCQKFSLTEIIKEPTGIKCSTSTLLDNILTNSSQKFSQKGVTDLGISGHQVIYCTREIKRTKHNMHNQIPGSIFKKV